VDLEILFWLIILLAPVLSRLFRGKQNKGRRPPPQPVPSRPERGERELTPFEEALRQIQEAMTEGRAEEQPRELEPEPLKTKPPPAPSPRPAERMAEFRPSKEPQQPRFFDDAFESAAPSELPGRGEHYHEPLGDTLSDEELMRRKRRKDMSKWQQAVKNVVILSDPRSRSRWTPPGH
jgi:hypothetical protein